MNTIKEILVVSFLLFSLGAISNSPVAAGPQTGVSQPINNTIAHLEAALSAVNADDLEGAQEHIKASRQSSKEIIGGSVEATTARGSGAIIKARRHARAGDTDGTAAALEEALEIFNSMLGSFQGGSRGGLR